MTFLGCLSDPFQGLSDLQLGDKKVTLNHLLFVVSSPLLPFLMNLTSLFLKKRQTSKPTTNLLPRKISCLRSLSPNHGKPKRASLKNRYLHCQANCPSSRAKRSGALLSLPSFNPFCPSTKMESQRDPRDNRKLRLLLELL